MAIKRRSAAASAKRKPAERTGLGGGSVDRHLERSKKRRSKVFYSVGDGNTVIVRAVDPKKWFVDGYVHPVEFSRKDGSTYTMDIRCLDPEDEGNPCPGCRDDLERRYKFWMVVIVRDLEKENKSGKVIGTEDQLRILSGASRLVKALNAKQRKRDLSKRDLEIEQRGTAFEVEYDVEWATDEDEPLTEEDQELIDSDEAAELFEAFKFHTTIRDEDNFYDLPQQSNGDDDEDIGERSKRRKATFAERSKKGRGLRNRQEEDDDEDDDDDDEAPPRRRAKVSGGKSKVSKPVIKSPTKRRRTR